MITITFEDRYFNDDTTLKFNREAEFSTLTIGGWVYGYEQDFNLNAEQVDLLKTHLSSENGSIVFEDLYLNDGSTLEVVHKDAGCIEFAITDGENDGGLKMSDLTIVVLDEEQVRVLINHL